MNGKALVEIIDRFGPSVFSQNIRLHMGDTEVNLGIAQTVQRDPELFWYFNNGITILADKIDKYIAGGNSSETGMFRFTNLNIVNGAQTVGSLVRCRDICPENLAKVKVWTRFIEISTNNLATAKAIARFNNTQNRIDSRSFVALDPLQARWAEELQIDEITYTFRPGEIRDQSQEGFDFSEAAVARACANSNVSLAITAKREVSALWRDINKPPYRVLFNRSVDGMTAFREVKIMRIVQKHLEVKRQRVDANERQILTYGNLLILHKIFQELGNQIHDPGFDFNMDTIGQLCDAHFYNLKKAVKKHHKSGQIANLLKNATICRELLG